jgi:hypothetical protein
MRALIILWICVCATFAADAPKPAKVEAKDLFNGKDLSGWKKTEFGGEGEVEVKEGAILAHQGALMTGVQYTNALPKEDYVISLEAKKIEGDDFFCALTFPVADSNLSLIVGGWGGTVVGLSNLDGLDASENDTTKYYSFAKNKWYKIRVEVRKDKIKVFVDGLDEKSGGKPEKAGPFGELIVDASLFERKVGLRPGPIELQAPFGLSAYETTAEWRKIRIEPLPPKN